MVGVREGHPGGVLGCVDMEEIPHPHPNMFSTEKRRLLFIYLPAFILVSLIASIAIDELAGENRVMDIVMSLGLNISAFAWCRMDSRERGYDLHRFFPFAIIIFGFLALLYYLFRSRGFRGGLIATGWLILYVVLCLAAVILVGLIIVTVLLLTGLVSSEALI